MRPSPLLAAVSGLILSSFAASVSAQNFTKDAPSNPCQPNPGGGFERCATAGSTVAWTLAAPYWDPTSEQYYWAIDNPDGSPRAAYTKLAEGRANGSLP